MIDTIIFDLAEVLLTGIKATGFALAEKHKLDTKEFPTPLLIPLVQEFFHGNVKEDTYIDELLKEYPQLGSREELKQHIRENFVEVEGTREIVIRLKNLGYALALLSVHSQEWIVYCEQKYDFHQLFDVIAYSYQDKVSKPDKQSFTLIMQRLKAKPEQCLFIDDSIPNVNAAMELGIQGIVFTSAEDLNEKLKQVLPDY